MISRDRIQVLDAGLLSYDQAHLLQQQLWQDVKQGRYPAGIIFCSHAPVITFGRTRGRENLLVREDALIARGIEVRSAERGGDVTYHGPGQLTAYPVCDLSLFKKDVHWYLRSLEEVVLDVLARFGIAAGRLDGLTGVWAGNAKIASIGIGIRHWVTWHGVSIVVHKEDLDNFSLIRPCGMDIRVTSMETLLQRPVSMQAVKSTFVESFGKVFVPVFE